MNKRDRNYLDIATTIFALATGAALVFAGSLPILSGIGVAAILLIAFLRLIDRDAPTETEDVEARSPGPWPREELAALDHRRWSHWMGYMFSKGVSCDNGDWVMPAHLHSRWTRQMNTAYYDLPEQERASNREWADRLTALLLRVRRG